MVPCPRNVKSIRYKWIYTVKHKSDGTLDQYKARLVAIGYSQEYGIDYLQKFAPVAKMTTVRIILALATAQQWSINQMNVKNAFLHGKLHKTIYMKPPLGLSLSTPNEVCKLKRSLYSLNKLHVNGSVLSRMLSSLLVFDKVNMTHPCFFLNLLMALF